MPLAPAARVVEAAVAARRRRSALCVTKKSDILVPTVRYFSTRNELRARCVSKKKSDILVPTVRYFRTRNERRKVCPYLHRHATSVCGLKLLVYAALSY
jgi:hypothetical protein